METKRAESTPEGRDHEAPIVSSYRPRPPGSKRNGRRVIIIAGAAIAIAAALWLGLGRDSSGVLSGWDEATVTIGPMDNAVQVSGSVEMKRYRTVLTPEEGVLARKNFKDGDWVRLDEVIAEVVAPDLEDSLTSATTDLAAAGRELESVRATRVFALERERIDLDRKGRAVSDADEALARARSLEAAGAGTARSTSDAQRALVEAREALSLSELSAKESAQSHEFQLAALTDRIDELKATKSSLESRIAALRVRSPLAGRLLSWKVDEGEILSRYSALATVANTGEPEAFFAVAETTAAKLSVGMKVNITVGSVAYPGVIALIGREAKASSDLGSAVQIVASFSGDVPEFAAGATASGEVLLASNKDALLLPRGVFLSSGNGKVLYVIQDGYAVRTPATFGASAGGMIEVLTGAKAGDRVIVSDYGAIIDLERVQLGGKK